MGQFFRKVAKLRRSMYGFCTRMNFAGSIRFSANSRFVNTTFSPVLVDRFSIRILSPARPD